jgi:2'-5' RNA ligase
LPGAPQYLQPENYHLTLLFLGNTPDAELDAVAAIGEAQRGTCTSLRFDRWEYWKDARAVVASTPDRPEPLLRLRANLAAGLERRGVGFDDKPLRPHITVARKLAQAPVLPELSKLSWTLRGFSLVSSLSAPGGSVYTVVATWPLLDTAPSS